MIALTLLLIAITTTILTPTHAAIAPPPLSSNNNKPNMAYVQMQIIEISKIDGVEQAFHADFYMLTTWAAPLAGTPFNGTEDLSKASLDQYFWSPQLEFINERDAVTKLVDEPFSFVSQPGFNVTRVDPGYVLPAGWVWITEDQRYICDYTTDLGMQDFPFDSQYMQFLIESYWSYEEVNIRWAIPRGIANLVPAGLNIVGWTFVTSQQEETPAPGILYQYNQRYYPRLTIRTQLDRQPHYYLMKIVSGVAMLVYMCIWIFSLAVDEADRQMGTLQIFAGLVTFLFVASGDTPKVPYQTRLDVFMLWSFFNVTFMLFLHGSLYFWRECDVEDLLEERERAEIEEKDKKEQLHHDGGHDAKAVVTPMVVVTTPPDQNESGTGNVGIEMHAVASPSGKHLDPSASSSSASTEPPTYRASISQRHRGASQHHHKGPISHIPVPQVHTTTWRLREDEWHDWTMKKWFLGLHATRKWDAIIIPFLLLMYSIGLIIIFGRPVSKEGKLELPDD